MSWPFRALACVVGFLVVFGATGCGRRAGTEAGPATESAPERSGGGGGGPGPDPAPTPDDGGGGEIGLSSPRVVLGPIFTGCEVAANESPVGAAVLVVAIGCDPGRTTTVTLRNDGSEPFPASLLEGAVVLDPATAPPPDLVSVSATSSTGDPCSAGGPTFSCTLGEVAPASSAVVTVSYARSQDLTARFDLTLSLAFGSN